jgi:hypothetical protein
MFFFAEFRVGETLDNRYTVFSSHGKGVFSTVLRARDLQNNQEEVAIKVIRANATMYKAGQKELQIIKVGLFLSLSLCFYLYLSCSRCLSRCLPRSFPFPLNWSSLEA